MCMGRPLTLASRRGATALASFVSITAIFIQFFTPPHANGMLLVGKLINGYALGMYVSSASSYCAEISPLALRGITTGSVNLWIVSECGRVPSAEGCVRPDPSSRPVPVELRD